MRNSLKVALFLGAAASLSGCGGTMTISTRGPDFTKIMRDVCRPDGLTSFQDVVTLYGPSPLPSVGAEIRIRPQVSTRYPGVDYSDFVITERVGRASFNGRYRCG